MADPVYIRALAHHVPAGVLSNQHLERALDTTDAWIVKRTGIRERRYLTDYDGDSPGFELARRACMALAQHPSFDARRIGFLISASSHQDRAYPSAADRLGRELGLLRPCMQLHAACSSVAYAIGVARGLLAASPRMGDVLIVCGEAFTRHVDYGDRRTAILFGDAGCALLLSPEANPGGFEVVDLELGGEGSDIVSSTRRSETSHVSVHDIVANRRPEPVPVHGGKFEQDGRAVVAFVERVVPPAIVALLQRNGLAAADVEAFVCHQANLRLMESLVAAAGLPQRAHRFVVDRYGNTSSAGWVVALSEERGTLEAGDWVVVAAFGAGMTWATLLLRAT